MAQDGIILGRTHCPRRLGQWPSHHSPGHHASGSCSYRSSLYCPLGMFCRLQNLSSGLVFYRGAPSGRAVVPHPPKLFMRPLPFGSAQVWFFTGDPFRSGCRTTPTTPRSAHCFHPLAHLT